MHNWLVKDEWIRYDKAEPETIIFKYDYDDVSKIVDVTKTANKSRKSLLMPQLHTG